MKDKTKKLLRNTGLFAAAVGVTAAKTVKWSAKKVWDHKEEIAGGIAEPPTEMIAGLVLTLPYELDTSQ